ncbi:unnamed protein product [Cylicocyclus nassatus]|uniref:7TM GPCR serpentine receptor class x (Srx) domain-containing protein n=1 Tax=Cylicocyclus nassatus TaxID=53992 RepID=A0AA36MDD4_CYLNA|nr:unnamed protein product [Cylicocyclus nassatus]
MEPVEDSAKEDSRALGATLFVMATIGVTMCIIAIREDYRLRKLYLFKYFSLSHAIIHGLNQFLVVIIFMSTQTFVGQWMKPHVVGYFALSLQFSSLYTSITMSLNRLMSEHGKTSVLKINLIFVEICTKSFIEDCGFHFQPNGALFHFGKAPCGEFVSLYMDIIFNLILTSIVVPMDIYSLYTLYKYSKSRVMSTRRVKTEKPWFVQTLSNSLIFASMLFCFHIAVFFPNGLGPFLLTVAAWEFWLMSPQIVGVFVQKEYRLAYAKLFGLKVATKTDLMVQTTATKNAWHSVNS